MIQLHGVTKTVPSGGGTLTILHPMDLAIPAGRVTAITGPSGSGKSTLLGLIAGLDAPTAGRIVIDGVDITSLDEDGLARGLQFSQPELAAKACAAAFERGLIIETAGPSDEVMKLMPPLTISDTELDEGLAIVAESVRAVTEGMSA